MPRQTELSEAEVFSAIHGLVAAGVYPTAARLREALDHRGSPVVLQRFLSAWYEEFGPELARKATAKPPKPATGVLQAEIKRLTEDAMQEVEAAQAERIAAIDARAAALDAREAEQLSREQRMDAREAAHAEHLADLRAQLEAAAAAQSRLEETRDQAIKDMSEARGVVEALRSDGQARQAELDQVRAELEQIPALKMTAERAQADAAREEARVVELVGERDRLQRLASERAAELARLTGGLERADAAAAAQEATLAKLRQQLHDTGADLAAWAVRGGNLAREVEQAQAGRRADGEQIRALQGAEIAVREAHAADAARLESARAEIERLQGIREELASLKVVVVQIKDRLTPASTVSKKK